MTLLALVVLASGIDVQPLDSADGGVVRFASDQVLAYVDGKAVEANNACLKVKPGAKGWALVVPTPNAPGPSGACEGKVLQPEGEYAVGTLGRAKFLGHTPYAYVGELTLNAGAEVKPHQHDTSDELVVVLSGSGTFTVGGVAKKVSKGDTMHIVKGTQHGVVAGSEPLRVVQFYTPPGPEERFRAPKK
jgi:quercetin dioxygenase-like cupin family protein